MRTYKPKGNLKMKSFRLGLAGMFLALAPSTTLLAGDFNYEGTITAEPLVDCSTTFTRSVSVPVPLPDLKVEDILAGSLTQTLDLVLTFEPGEILEECSYPIIITSYSGLINDISNTAQPYIALPTGSLTQTIEAVVSFSTVGIEDFVNGGVGATEYNLLVNITGENTL